MGIALLWAAATAWAQPDYPPALWNPAYPGHWYTNGYSHSFCVIHDMEGYYLSVISYFQQSGTSASAHYCVNSEYYDGGGGNDGRPGGEITQMVREEYWAWHALCWNKYSFATEHEGFVNNPAWYTTNMYVASAGLQRHLCEAWGIPMDRYHIIGHNEYLNPDWVAWMATNWPALSPNCNGAQNHTDPGPYWNWTLFMDLINSRPKPVITNQPAGVTVAQGSNVTFGIGASGPGELSYQWRFNQAPLAGATASTYSLSNVQVTNAGGYSVLVSNTNGSTISDTAFLSVVSPLTNPAGCILAPSGLVNWWPAEGNAQDIFSGTNGIPANGFCYGPGKVGLAFQFDGGTSYVRVGAPSIPPPWTACFWVKRQNALGPAAALAGDGTNQLKLEQYNGTRKVGITKISVGDYAFDYVAPAGTWVHLAFVGTGASTVLYTNGVLQGTLAISIPLPRAYLGAGYVVASSSRVIDYMLGSLDEVMLFNRVLSGSELSAIYSAGSAGLWRTPQFTGMARPGPGQLALDLKGQTGKSFTILASTNLLEWAPLVTLPNPTGSAQFIDNLANAPQKFYRACQP